MSIQTAIRMRLHNKPGELARITSQLAQAGVDIRAGAGVACEEEGEVELIVNDLPAVIQTLKEEGVRFRQTAVSLVWMPDEPGALSAVMSQLAEAQINITSLYVVRTVGDNFLLAIGCDDPQKADKVLAPLNQPVAH